jgi:hypothetical protein
MTPAPRCSDSSQAYDGGVPDHDTFYAIRRTLDGGGVIVTVAHEVPAGARELGSFPTPDEAIDFAQAETRRLNASGGSVE